MKRKEKERKKVEKNEKERKMDRKEKERKSWGTEEKC